MKNRKKIALYGLGTETQKAICKLQDNFNILGLLDGYKTSGELFGYRIISLEGAIKEGVERIIVVARPGSCKAIARRIGNICIEHEVELYDIRGVDLLNQNANILCVEEVLKIVDEAISQDELRFSENVKYELFRKKIICNQDATGIFEIKNAYDIGYLFCAPLITDFVIWISQQIEKFNIHNIWFGARDGFLIKKLFEILNNKDTVYFLTSRTAAIRAGVSSDEDILYVDSMKFSGNLSENLKARFGIECVDEDGGLMSARDAILSKAKTSNQGYKKYIDTINKDSGDIAFFDFVAKGTTQFFIQKMIPNNIKGFYFLQLEPDFMKGKNLDIVPFYSEVELEGSAIFDNYYILETILTSDEPSVIDFNIEGIPVYAKETRSNTDIECFRKVQDGIVDYFYEYLNHCPLEKRTVSRKFDETLLKFIHNVRIKDENFLSLTIEDPFFNRMTDITDIL